MEIEREKLKEISIKKQIELLVEKERKLKLLEKELDI